MQLHRQDGSVGRGVAKGRFGGGEGAWNLVDQLTLYKPRGADYAPHTTARPPPRIQKAIYTSAQKTGQTFCGKSGMMNSIELIRRNFTAATVPPPLHSAAF